jgi:aryl-alcohol dehydrogenase-like predicted oxidoreductase
VLTHPWADRSDKREQLDVFLKSLLRSREDEADKAIVDRVEELAKKKGVGMAQVAMAWVMCKGDMTPICGLDSTDRIDQAIEGTKLTLTEEEAKYLEEPYLPKQVSGY